MEFKIKSGPKENLGCLIVAQYGYINGILVKIHKRAINLSVYPKKMSLLDLFGCDFIRETCIKISCIVDVKNVVVHGSFLYLSDKLNSKKVGGKIMSFINKDNELVPGCISDCSIFKSRACLDDGIISIGYEYGGCYVCPMFTGTVEWDKKYAKDRENKVVEDFKKFTKKNPDVDFSHEF